MLPDLLFFTSFLVTNITACKPVELGPLVISAGFLAYPMTYLLTVYISHKKGFAAAYKMITKGVGYTLLANTLLFFILDEQYTELVLQSTRTVLASSFALWLGDSLNAWIIDATRQVRISLYWRALASTVCTEALNGAIFVTLAFYGIFNKLFLLQLWFSAWIFKLTIAFILMLLAQQLKVAHQ